jgi:hypothetical protein
MHNEMARDKVGWIIENHHPEPLRDGKQTELIRILVAAEKEFGQHVPV